MTSSVLRDSEDILRYVPSLKSHSKWIYFSCKKVNKSNFSSLGYSLSLLIGRKLIWKTVVRIKCESDRERKQEGV